MSGISTHAKVLYGLLLDRMSLSAVVKARLLKLDGDHLRFVLMCLKENTTLVRNMRQYLLAALYNAPLTMNNYYTARVQHDMKTE